MTVYTCQSANHFDKFRARLYLDYAFDIDGVVVELEGLSGLKTACVIPDLPKALKSDHASCFSSA